MNNANFNFENHELSVTVIDGQIWFPANALAAVLGFANPRQAIATHTDKDDVQKLDAIDTMGRKQKVNFVNESGMYALIFGSTKDEAKRFKHWVTSEVLPSIRKTGSYALPTTPTTHRLSTIKERSGLIESCKWFIRVASYLDYSEVYNLIHHRFNVNKLSELTTEQVGQATEYIQELLLKTIARQRDFGNAEPASLPEMYGTSIGRFGDDACLWTRLLEPDEHVVTLADIPKLLMDEPYISTETLTAINYASSARLASGLKNPPFLALANTAKEV